MSLLRKQTSWTNWIIGRENEPKTLWSLKSRAPRAVISMNYTRWTVECNWSDKCCLSTKCNSHLTGILAPSLDENWIPRLASKISRGKLNFWNGQLVQAIQFWGIASHLPLRMATLARKSVKVRLEWEILAQIHNPLTPTASSKLGINLGLAL